jgi:orotidine-5'-phosphate decarboxylase
MFVDNLINNIKKKNNPTVVGLDPKIEYVPEFIRKKYISQFGNNLKGVTEAILEFNKLIIDNIYDIVPAVKPQLAYYEMYGLEGIKIFLETVNYAKLKGLLVIADGKRNDIGSTAAAYSNAFLGKVTLNNDVKCDVFNTDALTVNPYLGIDGIEPFINDCKNYEKGIFILVKTSNKSSGQLQDLETKNDKKNYEVLADLLNEWSKDIIGKSGYSSIGAVVGATYPEESKILREIMKNSYFLVPGYGSQGGSAKDVINSFNGDGLGAIINSSRAIMCAYKSDLWKDKYTEENFYEASRAEALRMRDDIMKELNRKF